MVVNIELRAWNLELRQLRKASEAGLLASLFNAKALSLELRNSQIFFDCFIRFSRLSEPSS
jgi:hypothetical protein